MDTTLNTPIGWNSRAEKLSKPVKSDTKLAAFINSQAKYETAWFLVSMVVQGVFLLPIPAVLVFYFNAPTYLVIFTLTFFFANIIAGMSSAGVKTIIYLFGASVIVHLLLLAVFIL